MNDFNLFKIEYDWYEGEHYETLIGKKVSSEEFEKDLLKAKKFAEGLIGKKVKSGNYLGKGYSVECLPEFYEQITWYLTKKLGYIYCYYDNYVCYSVGDSQEKKISITRCKTKIEREDIN